MKLKKAKSTAAMLAVMALTAGFGSVSVQALDYVLPGENVNVTVTDNQNGSGTVYVESGTAWSSVTNGAVTNAVGSNMVQVTDKGVSINNDQVTFSNGSTVVNGDLSVDNGQAQVDVNGGYIGAQVGNNNVTVNTEGVSINSGAITVNQEGATIQTNTSFTGNNTFTGDVSIENGNSSMYVQDGSLQAAVGNSNISMDNSGVYVNSGAISMKGDDLTAGSVTTGSLTGVDGLIQVNGTLMGSNANFTSGAIENLTSSYVDTTNANVDNDLTVGGKLTTNDFSAQTGYIKEGAIENLNSTNISTVNMSSENATIGDLTVTSSATVNGDFAVENGSATMNVGNGYIQSAVGGNSVTINSDGVSLNSGAVVVDSEGMHVNTTLDASNLKADEAYIKEGAIEHLNSDTITANEISSGSVSTGELNVSGNANVDGNLNVNGKFTINNQELATSVDISDVKGKIGVDATGNYKAIEVRDQSGNQVSTLTDAVNANYRQIQNNSNAISSLGNRVSDLGDEIDNVGAISAALAGLHPLDYDGTGSKFQISAAVGTYDGSQAAALGAFYHFNRDVMLSLGGATAFDGDQKTAANLGVTFRIGEGASGKAVSDDVMARLEAMDQKIAALEQENKDLKNVLGAIDTSLSKEFPDVPANHWAYEAVTKLAGNDVVAGYPDGEFHGDRTMTRYEMAEVIYKAMQKGAKVDQKLVNEFKPEMEQVAANQNA